MKLFFASFLFFVSSIGFYSCQKNIDFIVIDPQLNEMDTTWQNNIAANSAVISLKNDLKTAVVLDSFLYSNTGIVYTSNNFALTVPVNGLAKSNGFLPMGFVKKTSLLLQKKGDFIAMGIPTTSNGRLLITGGAFLLNLKNNNDDLFVTQGKKLTVKYSANNTFQNNKIYNLSADTTVETNWILNNDTVYNKSAVALNGYEIETNRLQYVQTAHLLDTAGIGQTMLSVKLPPNYTNTNSIVYASFNAFDCVTRFYANANSRTFQSLLLPINKSITITIISKQAGDYYLGTQQAVTTQGGSSGNNQQLVVITPIKKTLENIKLYLATL